MGGGSAEGNTMKHIAARCTAMMAAIVAAHVEAAVSSPFLWVRAGIFTNLSGRRCSLGGRNRAGYPEWMPIYPDC